MLVRNLVYLLKFSLYTLYFRQKEVFREKKDRTTSYFATTNEYNLNDVNFLDVLNSKIYSFTPQILMISSSFYFIMLVSNMNSYLVQLLSDDELFEAHYLFTMGISPLFWMMITFSVVLNIFISGFAGQGRTNKII